MDKFELAYQKVIDYMFKNDFTSYDPYDGLNTPLNFLKANELSRLGLIYFNKFCPLNLRRLFKIQESKQLITLCTIANAMYNINNFSQRELVFIDSLYKELKEKTLYSRYGYHCWDARKFQIQMRNQLIDTEIPGSVGNEICGSFLINYYKAGTNKEALDYISNLADLLLDKFYCERDGLSFFRYRINDPDNKITLNASLKATSFLIKASEVLDNNSFDDTIIKAVNTGLKLQKNDGSWNYTYWIDKPAEKKQIDFHQGFILDDLLLFMKKYGFEDSYLKSYEKGLDFYYNRQFLPNGQGIYRYPGKWPVDIHNQAQGIVTFTNASKAGLGQNYFNFARTIAGWTIENMQDNDGHFYFLKYPWFTNKIPYIRWSDSAMAYALSVFLSKNENEITYDYKACPHNYF